jgi:hypothetical protein
VPDRWAEPAVAEQVRDLREVADDLERAIAIRAVASGMEPVRTN